MDTKSANGRIFKCLCENKPANDATKQDRTNSMMNKAGFNQIEN